MLLLKDVETSLLLQGKKNNIANTLAGVFGTIPHWDEDTKTFWNVALNHDADIEDKYAAWTALTEHAVPEEGSPDPKRGDVGIYPMSARYNHNQVFFFTPGEVMIHTNNWERPPGITSVSVVFKGRLSVTAVSRIVQVARERLLIEGWINLPKKVAKYPLATKWSAGSICLMAEWATAIARAKTYLKEEEESPYLCTQREEFLREAQKRLEKYIHPELYMTEDL